MQISSFIKKCPPEHSVLYCLWNASRVGVFLITLGRPFHRVGVTTENENLWEVVDPAQLQCKTCGRPFLDEWWGIHDSAEMKVQAMNSFIYYGQFLELNLVTGGQLMEYSRSCNMPAPLRFCDNLH